MCAVTPGDVRRASCGRDPWQIIPLQAGSLEGIFDDIATIAQTLELTEKGNALISRLKERLQRLQTELSDSRQPSLVMLEWTDPVFAMGNWRPELVEFACGELLIGNKRQYSQTIDWSDVRDANPELLIIAPCGFDLNRTLRELPVLESYPGWKELRAVRDGNVFFADGNLYFKRSGITAIDTAEIIADIIHGTSFFTSGRVKPWYRLGSGHQR